MGFAGGAWGRFLRIYGDGFVSVLLHPPRMGNALKRSAIHLAFRAGDRIRTDDVQLGKLAFYH
jgi:hypothetical protein